MQRFNPPTYAEMEAEAAAEAAHLDAEISRMTEEIEEMEADLEYLRECRADAIIALDYIKG